MSGKVVVITGASAGIGAELAKQLAAQGHSLVLAARREAELKQVAQACGRAIAVVADVTRRADVERIRDEALKSFGRVDVWVNNAGRGIGKRVLELTDSDIDEMILVNVKSALYGMQAILPHFQQRGDGHLINVSSFLGRVPFATLRSAYSASKAYLNSLTANLRMDLARDYPRIHISTVMPGPVATDFHKNALGGTPQPAPGLQYQSPEEVAASMVRLIEKPAPELYTAPEQPGTAARYYQDIGAFEQGLLSGRR